LIHKLLNCDNPDSIGMQFIGIKGILENIEVGEQFKFRDFVSSSIESITEEEPMIIIKTKNTRYVFI